MSNILDNDHSKSGLTVCVGVSIYTGTLDLFHPFTGQFFKRNYHVPDFAKKLDLTDIAINSEEVLADGYNLKAGYSVEMKEMLEPDEIFENVFADTSPEPLETRGVFDLQLPGSIDPTVDIVADDRDYDYDSRAHSDPWKLASP